MSNDWSHGNTSLLRGRFDYFSPGDWNFRCDECGIKWKASYARKRWDNCMVCPLCFEIRHPQDFLRGRPDRPAPPWTRPDPTPVFVDGGGIAGQVSGNSMLLDGYMLNSTMLG